MAPGPLTKDEFAAQCLRGASQASGLPVTAAVLSWTAAQLKRGDPPWWALIAKAWEKRRFVAWSEAWGLYLSALHFEALSDAQNPLVPFFPSCGGTSEADPTPGLARFLAAPTKSFLVNLAERERRTYIAPRAQLWLNPAMLFFQRRRLPFYLVEINAGAGLNLIADQHDAPKEYDSDLVSARIGLDPEPLDPADIMQRRWLTAGVWPDFVRGITDLDAACDLLQKGNSADAAFVQLAPCATAQAPAFVAKNVPVDEDVGLLLMNMGTTVRMDDDAYAAFAKSVAAVLKPWGDRGLWVEIEAERGRPEAELFELRVHRLEGDALKSFSVARFDLTAKTYAYSDAAAAFLAVEPKPKA